MAAHASQDGLRKIAGRHRLAVLDCGSHDHQPSLEALVTAMHMQATTDDKCMRVVSGMEKLPLEHNGIKAMSS